MPTKTRKPPATTKRRRDVRVKQPPNNGQAVVITEDRLVNAKEAERHLNDARLTYEELKAKHGAAKAEVKLLTAKRNRIISTATEVGEVEDAQREVTNARRRMNTAKDAADAAKDEMKGWEESLQKALSGEQPLFDLAVTVTPDQIREVDEAIEKAIYE
jgi:chromosome segregation ATPase